MADRTTYPARIVTPDGVVLDEDVQMLIVTGVGGQIGMLARHAPLVADLKVGFCRAQLADGEWRTFATAEGFATVHDSTGLVVVEEAVEVEAIDPAEADAMITEQRARIDRVGNDDLYAADVSAAEKRIEWGEHLKRMHAEHAGGGIATGTAH